jgi:two-component system sensor histidine kinase RpfC
MDTSSPNPRLSALDLKTTRMRLGIPEPLFEEFLRLTRQDIAGLRARLRESGESGDWERAVQLAHAIKGLAADICAEQLAEAARRLESAVRSGETGRWRDGLRALDAGHDQMEKAFEAEAENHSGGG